jgi:hypothetical protein
MAHPWFQHVLAPNESNTVDGRRFTSFLEDLGLNEIADKKSRKPIYGSVCRIFSMVNSGKDTQEHMQIV